MSTVPLTDKSLLIRADLLIKNVPHSITREAFEQYKASWEERKKRKLSDSVLLDRLGKILCSRTRLDHSHDPFVIEYEGQCRPVFWRVTKHEAYLLAVAPLRYPTLVGIQPYELGERNANPSVHEIEVNDDIIGVTDHALTRFVERWVHYEQDLPSESLKLLTKLLRRSEVDELSPLLRVKRLLNNGVIATEYRRSGPWRMVILNEGIGGKTTKTLLTFERRLRL